MDAIRLEYSEDRTAETYADHLLSSDSPSANDIYEESPELPRVGEEYQVEIPSLLTELERFELRSSQDNVENGVGIDYSIGTELAIPVMWIQRTGNCIKHEQEEISTTHVGADETLPVESGNYNKSKLDTQCNVASQYAPKNSVNKEFAGSINQRCEKRDEQIDIGLFWLEMRKAEGHSPLPGSASSFWSETEKQSFILGLYIFGKNLVQVKKFMDSKEMGDILSYYYGKFYRSDAYHRWSECRRIKSRKCIHGQRIFTGWRQQEILSRVLPTVLKEVRDTLLEAVKAFNEGRASLEEFVLTLRAAVDIQVLVDAIGIGKGKQDLTGIILDPIKTNQSISLRSEIPVGKACSSLTSADIIKFLTGDFRLSKAKSNDLFWEAVWPRLLARGWHSEQPKDVTSKSVLVFLMPGIKKFSRKKLVKGNHYFDSVSDVLNKVASDPGLLELEVEGANSLEADTKSDQNGLSDHQQRRHCYLQPRIPNCNSELMKFTVVDTSLVHMEAPFKVRELRSLPSDATCSYGTLASLSRNLPSDSSEKQSDSDQESDQVLSDDKKLGNSITIRSDLSNSAEDISRRSLTNGHIPDEKCLDLLNLKQPVKEIKCHFSRRVKSSQQDKLVPVSKRRRLTACSKYAGGNSNSFSCSKGPQLKRNEVHCKVIPIEESDTADMEVAPFQGMISSESSEYGFSGDFVADGACETAWDQDKPQSRTLIDLNHSPPDSDACEPLRGGSNIEKPSFPLEGQQQHLLDGSQSTEGFNGMASDQQASMGNRRQSTRNRPPTARALEALACGFLGTKRKGRGTRTPRLSELAARPSRRARRSVEIPAPDPAANLGRTSPNTMSSGVVMDELYRSECHVQFDRKEIDESLGVP